MIKIIKFGTGLEIKVAAKVIGTFKKNFVNMYNIIIIIKYLIFYLLGVVRS